MDLFSGDGTSSSPALASCTDPPSPGVNWQRCAMDGLELKSVNLAGARLRDSSFFRADLTGSDLSGTESFKAKFVNASLLDTRFDGAQLYEADLTKADLTGGVQVVDGGLVHIMKRQKEGWNYVRP